MINSTPISQIYLIQQRQRKHRRILQKIYQSPASQLKYSMTSELRNIIASKKNNHENWKRFHNNSHEKEIEKQNQKIFDRLIDITIREGPYSQTKVDYFASTNSFAVKNVESRDKQLTLKPQRKYEFSNEQKERTLKSSSVRGTKKQGIIHHNRRVQNLRRSKTIEEENCEIVKRIMKKTGELNHARDLQNFRETRKFINQMNKFQQMKRVSNFHSNSIKIRAKTLPAKKQVIPKIQASGECENLVEFPSMAKEEKRLKTDN